MTDNTPITLDFKESKKVAGDFAQFADLYIYHGTEKGGDSTIKKLGNGKYTKLTTVKLPLPETLLKVIGVEKEMLFTAEIEFKGKSIHSIVKESPGIRNWITFTEVFTCQQDGGNLSYTITIKGNSSLPSFVHEAVNSIYVNARLANVKALMAKCKPPETSSGLVIPQ